MGGGGVGSGSADTCSGILGRLTFQFDMLMMEISLLTGCYDLLFQLLV